MANKVQLGKRPKTFKPIIVTFAMPDGTDGAIEVTYKYRTRIEFGQMIDEIFKSAGADTPTGAEFSLADVMEKTRDKNADYLVKIVDSWNLDAPADRESFAQLADEIPAAVLALMERYRMAASEGRLGN